MTGRIDSWIARFLGALAALVPVEAIAQCAMCGTAIQSADDPLGRGILWSVLFLISLPYLIVGSFALALVWTHRRAKSRRERRALHLVGGRLRLAADGKEN